MPFMFPDDLTMESYETYRPAQPLSMGGVGGVAPSPDGYSEEDDD
jgi:hypothetical protein